MYLLTRTQHGPLQTMILYHPNTKHLRKADRMYLCLFHGYGASASNLRPLLDALALPEEITILLPNAPIEQLCSGNTEAFAWWPLDLENIILRRHNAKQPEALDALCKEVPAGLVNARESVLLWLAALERDNIIHPDAKLVLGGFSQGAMLATDIALHAKRHIHGLCVLSGALINQKEWESAMQTSPSIPRFQSHGTNDDILPFSLGVALHNCLQNGPLRGEFLTYEGAHSIPREILPHIYNHIYNFFYL